MKRILALFLVLALFCSFSACKKENTSSDADTNSPAVQTESKTESTNSTSTQTTEFVEPKDYAAVLQLTINPQFNIYVDKNYKVKAVEPLNDDAKDITIEYRYIVDDTFETVIDRLISIGKDKGYVQRNSPIYIEIFYLNEKTVNTEEFTNRIRNLTKEMSQQYNAIVRFNTPNDTSNSSTTTSSTPTHTHSYSSATCTEPKKCSCGATEGKKLGHKWNAATCTTAKTCKVCKKTSGEALGHKWQNATCQTPKKCFCGATKGKKLGHNYSEGKCTRCNEKDPNYKTYDAYINGVGFNLGKKVTIEVILKTSDKKVDVCPCLLFYKKTNNGFEKYDMVSGLVDYFGEEPTLSSTVGEALEIKDGNSYISYGMWRWFQTDFANKDIDFSNGKVLLKLKYTVNQKGNFVLKIKDGKNSSVNNNKYTDSLSIKIY